MFVELFAGDLDCVLKFWELFPMGRALDLYQYRRFVFSSLSFCPLLRSVMVLSGRAVYDEKVFRLWPAMELYCTAIFEV